MLRFVVTTDWHIDAMARFFASPSDALAAQFKEIEKPFRWAVDRGIRYVFVAGDLGEHHVISEEGKLRLLSLLLKYDGLLDVHIILGNHDVAHSQANSLSLVDELYRRGKFSTVHIYTEPRQVSIEGIPVNFLPWPATDPIPAKGRVPCLNVAHLEVKGATRDNGLTVTRGEDPPDEGDYWVIGHLHTYQKGRRHLYPGTGWQKNFGEKGVKGWCDVVATLEEGELVVRHRHIDGKPALKLTRIPRATPEDLVGLSTSPSHLYSITMEKGYEVPASVKDMPNVVSITGHGGGILRVNTQEQEDVAFDYTKGLKKALSHLSEKQQQIAWGLVAEARQELGL